MRRRPDPLRGPGVRTVCDGNLALFELVELKLNGDVLGGEEVQGPGIGKRVDFHRSQIGPPGIRQSKPCTRQANSAPSMSAPSGKFDPAIVVGSRVYLVSI